MFTYEVLLTFHHVGLIDIEAFDFIVEMLENYQNNHHFWYYDGLKWVDSQNTSKIPAAWFMIKSICCPGDFIANAIINEMISSYKIEKLIKLFPRFWQNPNRRSCYHTKQYCLEKALESRDQGKIDAMLSVPDLKKSETNAFHCFRSCLNSTIL